MVVVVAEGEGFARVPDRGVTAVGLGREDSVMHAIGRSLLFTEFDNREFLEVWARGRRVRLLILDFAAW